MLGGSHPRHSRSPRPCPRVHKISREQDNQLPATDAASRTQNATFPPRGPSIFIPLCLSLNTGKSNASVPLTPAHSPPPRGSAYSHYPETSEWGVNRRRLKSQKKCRRKVTKALTSKPALFSALCPYLSGRNRRGKIWSVLARFSRISGGKWRFEKIFWISPVAGKCV